MATLSIGNWLDKAIEYVAPVHALSRVRARTTLAIAGQWVGARTDRRETAGWVPHAGSADSDNLQDLPMLRTRSRDTQRSEPIARGAINTVVTKTVATGLTLKSVIDRDVLGLSAEQATAWQETTQREFRVWAHNPRACDLRAELNFYGLQDLALRSALESGDVIALLPMRQRAGLPYQLKVQLIEADRLCNQDDAADTPKLAGGIARDADGAPLEYHILKTHPGSYFVGRREWDVVAAFGRESGRRNLVHLKEMLRPEQSRGVPYLAPVIEPLKQLGKYSTAELNAAVVSALFTVFVKTHGGVGLGIGGGGGPAATAPKSGDNVRLASGAIIDLAAGEDIVIADPKRPNQAFDPFVLAILRQIGVALELPFEVLVKHFTASYTAARAALLEAWSFIKKKREWLGTYFCDPIFEGWLEEAILRGRIEAPGFFDDPFIRSAYLGTEWIGDAPPLLDPLKEIQAASEAIESGLSNHSNESLKLNGVEWAPMHEQLANELAQRRQKGTILESAAVQNVTQPGSQSTSPPRQSQPEPGPDKPDQEPSSE